MIKSLLIRNPCPAAVSPLLPTVFEAVRLSSFLFPFGYPDHFCIDQEGCIRLQPLLA
jgi:hypothetical protein